jgi:predicted Fe-Mo cluster-binding NifX family protein
MKVAITSTGNNLQSDLDIRFGRCKYFAIYDTEKRQIEFIENINENSESGAGSASLELVAGYQVKKIISGEMGMKIKPLLDSMKIQIIIIKTPGKKVQDIIELLHH